ncbi:MAG: N-acetyltransferase [Rhodoferax sp.]|nr:MAG: N-acetyltransferase [Rhodoferax sp.]
MRPCPVLTLRVDTSLASIDAAAWDGLLQAQATPTPFLCHAYLLAMETTGCAAPETGWEPHYFSLWDGGVLQAACALYVKSHSYGEYVFDWAWANAYHQHGLRYYPKAVLAVPFTPVPGSRLLARSTTQRTELLAQVRDWCNSQGMSSLHLLFGDAQDMAAANALGMLERHTVQFHWTNSVKGYRDFDEFLSVLAQDKRKKVRQERRKVREAGVSFSVREGSAISETDWDFFYRCYERTYLEHGNPPYLNRAFFSRLASHQPEDWVMFIGARNGVPIASSLIAIYADPMRARTQNGTEHPAETGGSVAYGRYWGALEPVDCLHFEACYYQPLQWCIAHGIARFEGGAQGEHKMARGLLPVTTCSAHWLAHPQFADAVDRFLERERAGVQGYLQELEMHSPLRGAAAPRPDTA